MMNRRIELVLFIELRTYIVEVEFVQNLPDIRREAFFVIVLRVKLVTLKKGAPAAAQIIDSSSISSLNFSV